MLPQLLMISHGTLNNALEMMYYAFPFLIGTLLTALAIIAAIDYFWQRHVHIQQLRMTKQEVKDEHKQTDGSPEVKAKIRRMQMEKSRESSKQRESLKNVSDATAVITNPTHFAVALKYTPGEINAPTIVAMGQGIIAKQIIERAQEHNIPSLGAHYSQGLYFSQAKLVMKYPINSTMQLPLPLHIFIELTKVNQQSNQILHYLMI